ncbi:hypothetical protein ACFOLH_17660, partial [Aquipuribacter hungaricus]
LKHRAGWSVRLDPDGTLHWRTPAGIEHVSPGRRLGMPEHDRPLQPAVATAGSAHDGWSKQTVVTAGRPETVDVSGSVVTAGLRGFPDRSPSPAVPRQGPEPPAPDLPPF